MRVLIADDARFMRSIVGKIVESTGCKIVGEAENGAEAVEKYIELQPDLVIMDVIMPEKTGIEALVEMKAINKDAKVVICSAMGQPHFINEATKNGAMDFLVKPVSPDDVIGVLKRLGALEH